MSFIWRPVLLFIGLTLCAAAWGQSNAREPHIGYLYPAGGQQGSVIQITAGGQFLRGASGVHVSGEGVHGSIVQYMPPLGNLSREQRQLLQDRLKEVREKRLAELFGTGPSRSPSFQTRPPEGGLDKARPSAEEDAAKVAEVRLPDHPLLYNLENKSLRELAHITHVLFASRAKQQLNRQLAESVLIEIAIDPGAEPGSRELRVSTPTGLTNPMVFQVGLLPEVRELEPNDQKAYPDLRNLPNLLRGATLPKGRRLPEPKPLELPAMLNGQIMPGDVDRFRFHAREGQHLVMDVQARSLIPYLADAVPGWFQATLALYDAKGKEVAFADDYRFSPDPVLFYRVPEEGEYELQVHDSIYRGREDFVYRIAVGEQPFITQTFPLGGRAGVKTVASIAGWNLPSTRLSLDTESSGDCVRQTAYYRGKQLSNFIPYAVDTLPECDETEVNDTINSAQQIEMPKIINGRIDRPGDLDVFRFKGRAGDDIVAEVCGRRLNSPLDSILRLTDASGNVLEWNDDHVVEDNYLYRDTAGLLTHHADSYLMAELPKDGEYYVELADSQHHGGEAYGYRLRIASPQPDFALRVTPSSLSVRAGGIVPVCVHALRKDGFDGEIEVVLKDTPPGFRLNGGRIPAGRDCVRMTLTASPKAPEHPVALKLEGRARVQGRTFSHLAVPADDVMQAFLYRHLVPAQELLVLVQNVRWRGPSIELAGAVPVPIPAGGSARVLVKTRRSPMLREMQLELNEPPEGVTLGDVTVVPEGLVFQLRADEDTVQSGLADNLIVEAFRESVVRQRDGKPTNQRRRVSMGFFPAIPIEIVQP